MYVSVCMRVNVFVRQTIDSFLLIRHSIHDYVSVASGAELKT